MSRQQILVIEDERDVADLIAYNLKRHEYDVAIANDGLVGLADARRFLPDLIVLDLMLPGMDGMAVYKELLKDAATRKIPVIMLTARGQTEDKIAGLDLGVDDYMTKPFSPKELVLRVKNLLKRTSKVASGSELRCGPFLFMKNSLLFYVDGQEVDLTSTEFKLLMYLCERKNRAQDRNDILLEVMGYSGDAHSRTLDTHMKRLRKKLGECAEVVETVRGVGYRVNVASD